MASPLYSYNQQQQNLISNPLYQATRPTSTQVYGPVRPSTAPRTTTPTNNSLGATMALSTIPQSASAQQSSGSFESVPEYQELQFDISPILAEFDAAEQSARASFGDTSAYLAGKESLAGEDYEAGKKEAGAVSEAARVRSATQKEAAVNEVRRQQSEVQQGLQARYGGTTGTGVFAGELVGREGLAQTAAFNQSHGYYLQEVDRRYDEAIGVLARDKQRQDLAFAQERSEATERLNNNLFQIRGMRAELKSQKAQLAARAMSEYQQKVVDINARNTAAKQAIESKALEWEQQVSLAKAQMSSKLINYNQEYSNNALFESYKRGGVSDSGVRELEKRAGLGEGTLTRITPAPDEENNLGKYLLREVNTPVTGGQ